MSLNPKLTWILAVLAAIASALVFYAVGESEAAIVTQFGRPLYVVRAAGLHAKWPWQSRTLFDERLQTFNPLPSELRTRDKKDPESANVGRGKVGGFTDYLSPTDVDYANRAMAALHPRFGYTP